MTTPAPGPAPAPESAPAPGPGPGIAPGQAPGTDRRRYPRHELKRPCRVLDERTGKYLHGTTCNYSQGGLLVRLHRPCRLSPGDVVRLGVAMVPLQGFMLARDMFDGTVIRALGTPNGETMIAVKCEQALAPLQDTARAA